MCPDTTGIGGVVVKNVNLGAEAMPANDIRVTIDIQSLSGIWSGSLKYGIVSKNSDGKYSAVYTTTGNIQIDEDYGIATLDLSGSYPYYLYDGRTYYIAVYSPYFANSADPDWMWFLDDPVPFTVDNSATYPPTFILGDVNNDGSVSIADVTALIDLLLNGDTNVADHPAADLSGDGNISIADVTGLIDYLMEHE